MLAITGGKGGCGKTTTAVGLARALAKQGLDPVVVDCDCDMPDLHHLADIDRTGGIDALAAGESVERACQSSTTAPGVRCLAAGKRANVDAALAQVTDWHDPVILDCPPGVGPDAVRPLRHATEALIVSTDHPESMADARTTAETARELDTVVSGAIVRTFAGENVEWTDESPILARVESVETPLENAQIRAAWTRAIQQVRSRRLTMTAY